MTFRFEEKPTSRSGAITARTQDRMWYASGSVDENFVISYALAATPAVISTPQGTLYRQDVKYDWSAPDYCNVTVPYGPNSRATGSVKITFDTTGGTFNLKASYQTMGSYKQPADAGAIPSQGGAIGVHGDEVDGVDVTIPALKISATFRHPAGVITLAQIKALARATGMVGSAPFLTFQPGEVLFLGCTGSDGTDAEAEITYQFAMSENLQNQLIGGITVVEKQGWDVSWIQFADNVDAGKPIKPPKYIRVERVYRRTNLGLLLGFGGG